MIASNKRMEFSFKTNPEYSIEDKINFSAMKNQFKKHKQANLDGAAQNLLRFSPIAVKKNYSKFSVLLTSEKKPTSKSLMQRN